MKKKSATRKQFNVRLPEPVIAAIELAAKRTRQSQSNFIIGLVTGKPPMGRRQTCES